MNAKLLRPLTAELVATALFVFVGAASVVMNYPPPGALGVLGVALAHGVGLAVLVTATMKISGGHLNPAVTVGLLVAGKVEQRTAGAYVGAQLVGAILGALLVKALLPPGPFTMTSGGTPALASHVTQLPGIGIEALLTFFLVSAVFATAVSREAPAVGGFGIGLAVFVSALVAGPLTGAALNPARAFGPALVAWEWHAQAVYWIGPLIGAIAAAFLWRFVLLPKDPAEL